jgi:ubiquinone/menaquinone biosynthesis C-methylase UbiE
MQPPNLAPDAFAGAAAAYARYRPPYPESLLRDLLTHVEAPARGRLLDLACGPGRAALDLAPAFERVWAIDLEPEMVEVGRQEAARRGAHNITWIVGRAEDLEAPAGEFDLITVGEAFHRLDQARILERTLAWLKPGGGFATLGSRGILDGPEPWQVVASGIAHRWMARAFPGGWGVGADAGPEHVARRLREAGFTDITTRSFAEPHDWTLEGVSGYLQSTSVCSRKALGDDFDAFEADLQAALLAEAESGVFHEDLSFGYTLGRKPAESIGPRLA